MFRKVHEMDRIVDMTSQPMRRMSARAMVHVYDGELEFSVRGAF